MSTAISNGVALDSDYLKVTEQVKKQSELDKDAFINLLITQMQYQDPLEPMDNSEMVAQLAQFTALEQMLNVAQSSQKQLANGMIGKYVEYLYKDPDTGESQYLIGKVDYVKVNGDSPILGIGDVEIELSNVYQVYDSSNIETNKTAFELIGKTVQGMVTQTKEDGTKETYVVEGEVQSVQMKDGEAYMVIGTDNTKMTINYKDLQNIVQTPSVTGKQVTGTYVDADGKTQTITGKAEYIIIKSSGTYIYVRGENGGHLIDFNNMTGVAN